MKSFTAKEFSRCPAKVYEAAREDGSVEIKHDRFSGRFEIYYWLKESPENFEEENKKPPIKEAFPIKLQH